MADVDPKDPVADGADEGATMSERAPPPPAPVAPLEEQVTKLIADRDKLKDQLLRTAADFDNYRKRSRKDVDDAKKAGTEDAIRAILPVADNLERALTASETATDAKAVLDGVKMVLRLFADSLERIGVTRVPAVGERFDPAVHEAIQQVETTEHPVGTITAELAAGYRLNDRLLRPAMVAVARPPAASAGSAPPASSALPGTPSKAPPRSSKAPPDDGSGEGSGG